MKAIKITPIFLILFYMFANRISHNLKKPPLKTSIENTIYNLDEDIIVIFNLGFARAISSLLWVNTLLESDEEFYKKKDLGSWMFIRFSTIAALDKKFYDNYLYGGKYLSIIKDDTVGAEELFNKGLLQYPNDFWLSINTAHNYLFEMGNTIKAFEHYNRVKFDPLVQKHFPLLPSLVAKLEREKGSIKSALELLKAAYDKSTSQKFRDYYAKKLYSLRAEIDLECLNSLKSISCRNKDFFDNLYLIDQNGIYFAKYKWKRFKFSKKTKRRFEKKRVN